MLIPLYYTEALLHVSTLKGPEWTVVQKQPSLEPCRLIVSTSGQHESCERMYDRTTYIYIYIYIYFVITKSIYVFHSICWSRCICYFFNFHILIRDLKWAVLKMISFDVYYICVYLEIIHLLQTTCSSDLVLMMGLFADVVSCW